MKRPILTLLLGVGTIAAGKIGIDLLQQKPDPVHACIAVATDVRAQAIHLGHKPLQITLDPIPATGAQQRASGTESSQDLVYLDTLDNNGIEFRCNEDPKGMVDLNRLMRQALTNPNQKYSDIITLSSEYTGRVTYNASFLYK